MKKITDLVREIAEPIVQAQGCSLWDVEYVKEGGEWFLRIIIDRENGVSIDDCEAVSRAVDPVLDEQDPIPTSYILEVSSAGLERELKQPEHFLRYIGSPITVRLFAPRNGVREFTGILDAYKTDGTLTISMEDQSLTFSKKEMAQVRLYEEI